MTASVTADIAAGLAARNEGQAATIAADKAVHRDFGPYIAAALNVLCARDEPFTAESVRTFAGNLARYDGRTFAPADNLIPAFIGAAAKDHRIVEVGRVTSTRPERRGSKISLWRAAPQSPAAYEAAGPNPAPAPHTGGRAAASRDGNPG